MKGYLNEIERLCFNNCESIEDLTEPLSEDALAYINSKYIEKNEYFLFRKALEEMEV